jgi:hypothetical protein
VINKLATQNAPSAEDLQQMFETAVCEIHQVEMAPQALRHRMPIVQRIPASAPISRIDAEKRAVSDAANALARLWKVSAHHAR